MTTTTLSDSGKPVPCRTNDLDAHAVASVVEREYGLSGELSPLGAERDRNYRLCTGTGKYVVKISGAKELPPTVRAQTSAMDAVAKTDPSLPIQQILSNRRGELVTSLPGSNGDATLLRVMTYLPGIMMKDAVLNLELASNIGDSLAKLNVALRGTVDGSLDQKIWWDLKRTSNLRGLVEPLEKEPIVPLLESTLNRFQSVVEPVLLQLPRQPIHNDFNPHNLIVDADHLSLVGILDFGDMVVSPVICDVAVAASYLVDAQPSPLQTIQSFVSAFHRRFPLKKHDLHLLPDLITARHAMTVLITEYRARRHPENAPYILRNNPSARRGLALLDDSRRHRLLEMIVEACPS